jgi:hypothetical protein
MNERIRELYEQARLQAKSIDVDLDRQGWMDLYHQKFAELIVQECIGILETEIELVKGYKSTACNDFDVRWHEGKIEHFAKLVEKSKEHFGVEE